MSFFSRVRARFGDVFGDDVFRRCGTVLVLLSSDPTFTHSDTENWLLITGLGQKTYFVLT